MHKAAIYISINPLAVKNIAEGLKNHEFRNYKPKRIFNYLYVYITNPVCELKYIYEIDSIVKYPDKITKPGIGNEEFNGGNKTLFAYSIKKVYRLSKPIPLQQLKDQYNFTPPQAFSYSQTYLSLTEAINEAEWEPVI